MYGRLLVWNSSQEDRKEGSSGHTLFAFDFLFFSENETDVSTIDTINVTEKKLKHSVYRQHDLAEQWLL